MKLLNQSLKYLSVSMFLVIGLWAFVFYFSMLSEIRDSVDEGLETQKRQILQRIESDTNTLLQHSFEEGFFAIRKIQKPLGPAGDYYADTMMSMQDADDDEPEQEPVRLLQTVFQRQNQYYQLTLINPMVEEDDLIQELLWKAVWLYVLLILCIVFVNNWLFKRLWQPFYSLLSQLKLYRLDKAGKLPEVETRTKEFRDLQTAVNTLLVRSLETYEQQKQFIGNASHELQTPLAVAGNRLELLIEKGGLTEAQAETLAGVHEMIQRLVRLNKSLLLLTRIESKQNFINQEVSLSQVIQQTVAELEEMADFKHLRVHVEGLTDWRVSMDPSLAETLVRNLIRNAIFHNVEGGAVEIRIEDQKFRVCNTAEGKALDAEKIFTRFYKSDDGHSGTGLGLAIVSAVCKLYGFSISYFYQNQQHCFEVTLN